MANGGKPKTSPGNGQPDGNQGGLVNQLIKLVPATGVFGALLYFLGRLHTEAYYSALQMNPRLLSFTSQDFMFSSFDPLIVALVVSVGFYLSWERAESIRDSLDSSGKPRGGAFDDSEATEWLLRLSISILVVVGILVPILQLQVLPYAKGETASLIGLALALLIYVYSRTLALCYVLWWRPRRLLKLVKAEPQNADGKADQSRGTAKQHGASSRNNWVPAVTIVFVLLFLAILPQITSDLATLQALTEKWEFPRAVLVPKNGLPEELRSRTSSDNRSIEVKMVTRNNGMTYVLKESDSGQDEWQVFAIPDSNIKDIIYYYYKTE